LTDERLAQLLSQTAVTFNSVLVQIDEFQEIVKRWEAGDKHGVTPGGFCEVLQGSTAMSTGVVILTGTAQIASDDVKRKLLAVYRRIHCSGELWWMSVDDIGKYFTHFLLPFVPDCSTEEWAHRKQDFLRCKSWSEQGSRRISIDMLKQFLMSRITESRCLGHGEFVNVGNTSDEDIFQVNPDHRSSFFDLVCNEQEAESYLSKYAQVHLNIHS
jgi:hypothetical protein